MKSKTANIIILEAPQNEATTARGSLARNRRTAIAGPADNDSLNKPRMLEFGNRRTRRKPHRSYQ